DIYGLSEVMGPGVAMECAETKDGLHIWEDHFWWPDGVQHNGSGAWSPRSADPTARPARPSSS
ncbi:hypothetical protein AB0L57_00005, partial [Nocardia sp. NPDC052254]|uniref:hypothetical protein n=1 Tax=Nocardia sp. NPDC052254 TaxID=3155681 RepID=UPI003426F1C1